MRTHTIPLVCSIALGTLATLWATPANAAETDPQKTLAPYFFIENGDPSVDKLPLEGTDVNVDISGVIADVRVTQLYKNDGERPIHARYIFPASMRAAVHGMEMRIGERIIKAKIKEKKKAERAFEQAKAEGKTASLLEQQRPNVFQMRVANILPGDEIEVELRYTELLVPTDAVYEFVFPTTVGPRYAGELGADQVSNSGFVQTPYLKSGEAPKHSLDLSAAIATGVPIQQLSCPSHQVSVERKDDTRARVVLDPSERTGADRDFVLRYQLAGQQISSGLMLYEGEHENFFLLMAQPPRRVSLDAIPPREYIFVIDVSGSMYGFPLDTAKSLLRDLIGSLRPTDTFNVMLFSGGAEVMAPRSLAATQENVNRALRLIDDQNGSGSTNLLNAMQQAMRLPAHPGHSRSFVVVTDGYIAAEESVFQYIRTNLDQANVFSFGIGNGVNRFLIDGVAKAGYGEPFVVTDAAESAETVQRFRKYIDSPVLTDIKVGYDGFAAYDVEPSAVPDLLAERPLVVFGKWRGQPKGTIRVQGSSGQGAYTANIDVAEYATHRDHTPLSYLWARARIAMLSDFNFSGETPEEVEEIVALGLHYNLLTKYTSFVAIDHRVRNTEDGEEVTQPQAMPRGVSNYAVGAEPELLILLLCVLALLAITRFRQRALGL